MSSRLSRTAAPLPVPKVQARVRRAFPVHGGKAYFYGTIVRVRTWEEVTSRHGTRTLCQLEVKFDDFDTDPRIYKFKSDEIEILPDAAPPPPAGFGAGGAIGGAHAAAAPGCTARSRP